MTNRTGKLFGASALAFATVLAGVGVAHAADGEIIVTAQKRAENLQKVPAAVSVLQGAQIGTAVNIENVQALVPTLNFRKGGTSLNSSLFLRGVGTINFSIAAEPSVATVLDGVVLARAGEAFGDLSDIERIEVLRGPQGTLFGKNASAGAINIVSKKPGSTFGGQVEASVFEDDDTRLKGSVDIPLSDTVRTRFTAFKSKYDGNIDNLTTKSKINGYDRWGVRGILDWKASEKLDVTIIGDYRKADDNCCGEVIGAVPAGANQAALNSLLSGVRFAGDETRQVRHNLVTQTNEESWGVSVQADYQLGEYTLTSITAQRGWDNREIREGDWLDRPAAYVGNAFAQLHDDGPQESKTFSQELRIASPTGKALEYVAGLYYYRADADRTFTRAVTSCTASTLAIDATGQRPCATGASTFASASSKAFFGSEFQNTAAFADGRFHVTDDLTLIGGVRVTRDELSYYHTRIPSPVGGLPGLRTDTTGFVGSTDNTNTSGRVGAQYQVTPNVMTYATWARGYKGPAFNVFFNMNATQRNVIEPETADSYEIGAKTAFFDNKLILNLAAFDAKYKNYQANNFDTLNGVVITRLTNAGDVTTKGFEADWLVRPTDNLTFTGGFAYTDAQVDSFRTPAGATQAVRPGSPLALSPKQKGTLGADYRLESSLPVVVYLNGQYSYTSEQFSDLGQNPLLRIDSYSLLDASIGFSDKQDRYRVTLFGKNLTDESFASLITPGGPGGALRYLIPREADRYFGVSLRAKFGG